MAQTQVTGRDVGDKSIFFADIDLSTAEPHPSLVAIDRFVIVDPTDGNIKTSTLTNLCTVLDSRYLLLTGGTVSGNLIVSGTTTLNAVTKVGTAMITNLNADMLDGYHASGFSLSSHSHNLTDGIFDGNGFLYGPYPVQPASGSTPATGAFYSGAAAPNSIGSVNYSGTMRAHVFNAAAVFGGNYGAYLGGSGMTQYDNEFGVYHGSGDQIIALMASDQGTDTYVYAGGQMIFNSSYFYLGGYVMSPRFHSTIGTGMPIQVASTTLCTNLNADLLDGNHASAFALSSHTHAYEPVIVEGTTSQYWRGDKTWQPMPEFGGTGTVTSVGLSMPSMFTVSGSPVTTSGTLTAALTSQTKNYVLVAPQFTNGVPSFRKLTADDMPDLSSMYDNYYSWNIKLNAGTTFQILKSGASSYTNAYNGINFIAGTGITLIESSVIGGALGITIDSEASFSGSQNTMLGRNASGYGVYSEMNPAAIRRILCSDVTIDSLSFLNANSAYSRRDTWVSSGASNVTYTGQTLTDITGLTILLGSNTTYEFEAILSVQTSAVTTGCQYAIAFSAAYSQFSGQIIGSITTSYARSYMMALGTASGAFLTTSGQTGQILIKGIIRTTAGGTLSIRHLKVTSGTSIVLPYSYFKVTEI